MEVAIGDAGNGGDATEAPRIGAKAVYQFGGWREFPNFGDRDAKRKTRAARGPGGAVARVVVKSVPCPLRRAS